MPPSLVDQRFGRAFFEQAVNELQDGEILFADVPIEVADGEERCALRPNAPGTRHLSSTLAFAEWRVNDLIARS